MKKLALGFLSVFMLLGGVLFSSCKSNVSLSLLTSEEITIFTNDEAAENFAKDNVEVKLENSSAGIRAEILKGDDVVKLSSISQKSDGRYSFDILTLGKKSGKAEVKVSSIEDKNQSKIVYVNVNTILEGIDAVQDNNVDARSNYFVVKGERENEKVWKDLVVKEFFDFNPVTANIYDVNWTFENDQVEIVDGDKVLAVIENNKLWVSKDYNLQTISLKATDITKGANNTVEFKVLEDSTIENLVIGETAFYANGEEKQKSASFDFVRNNVYESNYSGQIVINTIYDVEFAPVVKIDDVMLTEEEWLEYFSFDFAKPEIDKINGLTTYNFTINAYDALVYNKYGNLKVDFCISYKTYAHDIYANLDIDFNSFYQATGIELLGGEGQSLNKSTINVFSNYQNGEGFEMKAILMPDDVGLNNNSYAISIDTTNFGSVNPSEFAKFYYRGKQLTFDNVAGSNKFTTVAEDAVLSGDSIYVMATEKFDALENVNVEFIPYSNPAKSTFVNMNFYKISTGENLQVSPLEGDDVEFYISSSLASERKLKLNFKVIGLSTVAGLNINCANGKFVFKNLSEIEHGKEGDVSYVVLSCEVELADSEFEERARFCFEHVSGKKSAYFYVSSFIPLNSFSVSNNDKSATNYYNQKEAMQDYVVSEGEVEKVLDSQSNSLSSIMLEAGTSLPISIETRNATLAKNGVKYSFLNFEDLKNALAVTFELDLALPENVEKVEKLASNLFKSETAEVEIDGVKQSVNSLDFVTTNFYNNFEALENLDETYFSISKEKIVLNDVEFKGYLCVAYNGFDENHNEKTLLRVFAIESFNKVTRFASNVTTAKLYTSQTLSYADIQKSYVDVTISFRADDKIPTYTNNLSFIKFKSSIIEEFENSDDNGYFSPSQATFVKNSYYSLSDMSFINSGRAFRFRITANSTNLQSQVRDVLKIVYLDENGFEKSTEVQIEILNVKRMESVEWTTRTLDNEIYLNLTSNFENDKNFTITTSFAPSDANDKGLSYYYAPITGTSSDLQITTSSIGSTFNVNLNTNKGGYGYLYLLPNDMVKVVSGIRHFLVYRYDYDAEGKLIETPVLKRLSEIKDYFDMLVNEDNKSAEFEQYFLNNDGEKIYYKDLLLQIKITIADGLSEATALRVYGQSDLEDMDYAKYYKIMTNITLQNWQPRNNVGFGGMLFGNNEEITLTFDKGCGQLFNTISEKGILKDLTLAGNVTGSGFVANQNKGLIDNVDIDVYFDRVNNVYVPSSLLGIAGTTQIGAFVGENIGTISNSNNFGVSIKCGQISYAGGIAGKNSGTINDVGVEFYDFKNAGGTIYKNAIDAEYTESGTGIIKSVTQIGGIVGFAEKQSKINRSYVYAYSLLNTKSINDIFKTTQVKGVFVGYASDQAQITESFAFVGDNSLVAGDSHKDQNLKSTYIIKNSYISYYNGDSVNVDIYDSDSVAGDAPRVLTSNNKTLSGLTLDSSIWQLENLDSEVNFGYIYLKNIQQSRAKDVATLSVQNVGTQNIKALAVDEKRGILFAYVPESTVSNQAELSVLANLNTISLQELFAVTADEAQTLLVTSNSKDIVVSKNSIQMLNSNLNEFELVVYSKMDFSKFETFKFVILNNLPKVSMTLDGQLLQNEQVMLLQTGDKNARNVYFNFNNSIYLGGQTIYRAETNDYVLDVEIDGVSIVQNNQNAQSTLSASVNGTRLNLLGKNASSEVANLEAKLSVEGLADAYDDVVNSVKTSKFGVSVFEGATAFVIEDSSELFVKASENATFEATMQTDNNSDNLVFALQYGEIEIEGQTISDNFVKFVVDEKLTLNVSWLIETEESNNVYTKYFNVLIEIDSSSKHLIDKAYEFDLLVNAKSLENSDKFLKTLPLFVRTQEISDLDILAYDIENRQIKNSVLYLNPTSKNINAIAPSSDAIVAVIVDPAYAMMTHFSLTYSLIKDLANTNNVGTVNISRLSYNSMYGYYVNTASTSLIENGIRVNLTTDDKTGNGVYYFRIYVSGSFATACDLKLTLNYYNNDTLIKTGSQNFLIDYLAKASVKIHAPSDTNLTEGVSDYLMPKGSSAMVSVVVGLDQDLYSLTLQNNGQNISLSGAKEEVFDSYKRYTANLVAYVDAKLANGKENGVFYVEASVYRVINGEVEIKTSRASVYLVDFTVDGAGAKVKNSGATSSYNGKTYDAFYAYINSTETLRFDYSILPEEYIYDRANASEVEKVEVLEKKQNEFLQKNYYKDEDADYYINYKFNQRTGTYQAMTLKQQLSYATNEESSSKIYNDNGYFIPNDKFSISESASGNQLTIKGVRTGKQLMRLQTVINYQGVEFVYNYYFLIVVEVYSDEEAPTQISSGEDFVKFATESEHSDDYILMNDIVLENYTPLDTDLIDSLDGNGFTIHLNSFAVDQESSSLNLALFDTVASNTTLKNVRVNNYGVGEININISQYTSIDIAGFVLQNNGIIYNCEVVSYFDRDFNTTLRKSSGIVVNYMLGENTDPIQITNAMKVTSNVSGFAGTNNGSIMNSRVGGENFKHIVLVDDVYYVQTQDTDIFTIKAQGNVAGFVNSNGTSKIDTTTGELVDTVGYISACYVDNVEIVNQMDSITSITAGFAIHNYNNIQGSYVEANDDVSDGAHYIGSDISAIGYIAGFVYENDGLVKNSYANIAIDNTVQKGSYVSGFVYKNNLDAEVKLCFASCKIEESDVNEMKFSGVDPMVGSLNLGTIEFSYYYNSSTISESSENKLSVGPLAIDDMSTQDTFYGFSFASSADAYDGIWSLENDVLSLTSANNVAISNRYAVTTGNITTLFYNKTILDIDTLQVVDLSYGSVYNPIIVRNSEEFAKAMGKATETEISAYKEYYNDIEVFGNYRLVNNLDMSQIDQNAEGDGFARLTTTTKTFRGLIDGNGFTISNINLGSNIASENYGLFAKLENAVIMNLDMIVDSIHNKQANIVGTLAGTAVNSRILAINIRPIEGQNQTSIFGNNIVGGVVGMLFGDSKMHDVVARRIVVYSSYNDNSKTIESNKTLTGQTLRELVRDKASLVSNVKKLSYAGAVVGYADIYSSIADNFVKFNMNPNVQNFDLVKIHVYDTVDIYAEVAGGLFGYVGSSTYVYDASIELNSKYDLSNPSYIISKNLYAGGLIGENHGAIFGSYARYEKTLQQQIEENQNNYYSFKNVDEFRGQQSIFSYANASENINQNTNDPMFVGGLVGYMASGYIHVAYNKLNVVSNSSKTVAVGGIIGYAGISDMKVDIPFSISEDDSVSLQTDVWLYDVYSAGDFFVNNTNGSVGAGVIGVLGSVNNVCASVAMKDVVSVNYYSLVGESLTADNGILSDENNDGVIETYTSTRHFALIGNILQYSKEPNNTSKTYVGNFEVHKNLTNKIYMFDEGNNYYEIQTSSGDAGQGDNSVTVGGYLDVVTRGISLNINAFAFVDNSKFVEENGTSKILKIQNIGHDSMQRFETAHAQMYSNFLPVGWQVEYWEHNSDKLFPEIQLLPKVDVVYLDAINSQDRIEKALSILKALSEQASMTVVVRGKVSDDIQDETCTDVDLTQLIGHDHEGYSIKDCFVSGSNVVGRLISYAEYNQNTDNIGKVGSQTINGGGKTGDNVGLIIDRPLFGSMNEGSSVEGLNIYMIPKDSTSNGTASVRALANESSETDVSVIDYSVVKNSVINGAFKNSKIILNGILQLEGKESNAGLIAPIAESASFTNIDVKLRLSDEQIENSQAHITFTNNSNNEFYAGILAGKIEQASSSTATVIEDLKVYIEGKIEEEVRVDYNLETTTQTLHAGLYAGKIFKTDNGPTAKLSLGISQIDNLKISINENEATQKIVVGGYVGMLDGVDKVEFIKDSDDTDALIKSKISIVHDNVETLSAGLFFGEAQGSEIVLSAPTDGGVELSGGIYQSEKQTSQDGTQSLADESTQATTGIALIGGLIGDANANLTIGSIILNFNLTSVDALSKASINSDETNLDIRRAQLKTNVQTYADENGVAYVLNSNSALNAIGAYVGKSTKSVTFEENTVSGKIDGLIDIFGKNANIDNVGALVGQSDGNFNLNSANYKNSLDIAYTNTNANSTANIGGAVGKMSRISDGNNNDEIATNRILSVMDQRYLHYYGNVVASVKNLNFGGGFGYIGDDDNNGNSKYSIAGIAYGGALKVWDNNNVGIDSAKVNVGGVVGSFELSDAVMVENAPKNEYSISNCYSYGDVFVNYPSEKNLKLDTYNFGGIVGYATNMEVFDCYSLMTSFNNRLAGTNNESTNTEEGLSTIGDSTGIWSISTYNVSAIVGANSDKVDFDNNYYNSGVCMAYQDSEGNIDAVYGENKNGSYAGAQGYLGYSVAQRGNSDNSSTDLLGKDKFGRFVNIDKEIDYNNGHKLNPILLGGYDESDEKVYQTISMGDATATVEESNEIRNINIPTSTIDSNSSESTLSKTNNITWVAVESDYTLSADNVLAQNLKNVALVGNGHIITRTIGSSDAVEDYSAGTYAGGLVNSLGTSSTDGTQTASMQTTPKELEFNMISGLVANLEIFADVSENRTVFGGVIGQASGNSFVYGVAVRGDLSVGGGNEVDLSGLVGQMNNGFINECAMNADILYRANASGHISGVADVVNGNTTIKATYTSGRLETYVSQIAIYALAKGSHDTENPKHYSHDIVNSFSISNIARSDIAGVIGTEVGGKAQEQGLNYLVDGDAQTSEIFYLNEMNITSGGTSKSVSEMAIGYDFDMSNGAQHNSMMVYTQNSSNSESLTKWYFDPYVNYGFASHGFGYMKNVITFTRTGGTKNYVSDTASQEISTAESLSLQSQELDANQSDFDNVESNAVKSYDYSPVGYQEILLEKLSDDWYLGVYNSGKFDHMLSAASGRKFVIVEDINILSNDMDDAENRVGKKVFNAESYSNNRFALDGNGKIVDFENRGKISNGIFGTVNGDIINLKINNIDIEYSGSDNVGALAGSVNGNINNVAVEGTLKNGEENKTTGATKVGAVVGTLVGNATAVDAVVNVTNYKAGSILGGIAGYFNGTEENGAEENVITYSSNSGQLISATDNTASVSSVTTSVREIELPGRDEEGNILKNGDDEVLAITEVSNYSSVTGGIVGYSNGGSVTYSYNTNAVLGGYTNTDDTDSANFIAGGIVGYANGTTISNNNNTGLVGAGNYKNEDGVAFAGGIFGYGTGATTISNCLNDGAVEAIGYEDGDSTTSIEWDDGSAQVINQYISNPEKLKGTITLVYNPGDTRRVFAYGLGVLGTDTNQNIQYGFKESNFTSTDNIKNDGNIGQVTAQNRIIFDRQGILQPGNDFKGQFSLGELSDAGGVLEGNYNSSLASDASTITSNLSAYGVDDKLLYNGYYNSGYSGDEEKSSNTVKANKIYTNGIDSYGFPIRVYMKDVMRRGYFGGMDPAKHYINDIEKAVREFGVGLNVTKYFYTNNEGGNARPINTIEGWSVDNNTSYVPGMNDKGELGEGYYTFNAHNVSRLSFSGFDLGVVYDGDDINHVFDGIKLISGLGVYSNKMIVTDGMLQAALDGTNSSVVEWEGVSRKVITDYAYKQLAPIAELENYLEVKNYVETFLMAANTEYYATSYFPTYDKMLQGFVEYDYITDYTYGADYVYNSSKNKQLFTLVAANFAKVDDSSSDSEASFINNEDNDVATASEVNSDNNVVDSTNLAQEISDRNSNIAKLQESNISLKTITVSGDKTAIVSTGTDLSAIYNPFYFKAKIDTSNVASDAKLNANSFLISKINGETTLLDEMSFSVAKKESDGWYMYGYFSAEPEEEISSVEIDISYNMEQTFTLGKNNVVSVDGGVRIYLTDGVYTYNGVDCEKIIAIKIGEQYIDCNVNGLSEDEIYYIDLFGASLVETSLTYGGNSYNLLEHPTLILQKNVQYSQTDEVTTQDKSTKVSKVISSSDTGIASNIEFKNYVETTVNDIKDSSGNVPKTLEDLKSALESTNWNGIAIYVTASDNSGKYLYKNGSSQWTDYVGDGNSGLDTSLKVFYTINQDFEFDSEIKFSKDNVEVLITNAIIEGLSYEETDVFADTDATGLFKKRIYTQVSYETTDGAQLTITNKTGSSIGYTMTIDDNLCMGVIKDNGTEVFDNVSTDFEFKYNETIKNSYDSSIEELLNRLSAKEQSFDAKSIIIDGVSYKVSKLLCETYDQIENETITTEGCDCGGYELTLTLEHNVVEEGNKTTTTEKTVTYHTLNNTVTIEEVVETVEENITQNNENEETTRYIYSDDGFSIEVSKVEYTENKSTQDGSSSTESYSETIYEYNGESWSKNQNGAGAELTGDEKTDLAGILNSANNKLDSSIIIGDIDANGICFINAPIDKNFSITGDYTYDWAEQNSVGRSIKLYADLVDSVDLTAKGNGANIVDDSASCKDLGVVICEEENKLKIEAQKFGEKDYTICWEEKLQTSVDDKKQDDADTDFDFETINKKLSNSIENEEDESEEAPDDFKNIILSADIDMSERIGTNTKSLYGAGHLIKSNSGTLISTNSSIMQKLDIVQSVSGESIKTNAESLIIANAEEAKMNDIAFYGNVRNLGEAGFYSNLNDINIFTINSNNQPESYLNVTTLGGVNVNMLEEENSQGILSSSQNVIITADGKMGQFETPYSLGTAGGNGGKAGNISCSTGDYYRVGTVGMGGYGADGKHGIDNNGGGAGGVYGSNGGVGESNTEGKVKLQLLKKEEGSIYNYAGNGGVGSVSTALQYNSKNLGSSRGGYSAGTQGNIGGIYSEDASKDGQSFTPAHGMGDYPTRYGMFGAYLAGGNDPKDIMRVINYALCTVYDTDYYKKDKGIQQIRDTLMLDRINNLSGVERTNAENIYYIIGADYENGNEFDFSSDDWSLIAYKGGTSKAVVWTSGEDVNSGTLGGKCNTVDRK